MEQELQAPVVLDRLTRIVIFAMAIVLICVGISLVVVVLNERSTQQNADFLTEQNNALQTELRCLRPPSLEYDRQLGELQIGIARGLIAVANDDTLALQGLVAELNEEAEQVARALNARETSLVECKQS